MRVPGSLHQRAWEWARRGGLDLDCQSTHVLQVAARKEGLHGLGLGPTALTQELGGDGLGLSAASHPCGAHAEPAFLVLSLARSCSLRRANCAAFASTQASHSGSPLARCRWVDVFDSRGVACGSPSSSETPPQTPDNLSRMAMARHHCCSGQVWQMALA